MASDLPSEFDVVVLGTGLPESILAAAFSRNGYKVLHLDRNGYYSGCWSSFNVEGVEKWKKKYEEKTTEKKGEEVVPELKEGEVLIPLDAELDDIFNISTKYYVSDATDASNESPNKEDVETPIKPSSGDNCETNKDVPCEDQFEDKKEEYLDTKPEDQTISKPKQKVWTVSSIKENWRRFNLDLAPKVLYCSGSMVELLIVSDVAKYCEFRTVSRVLTLLNGQLEKVPCSRADVFGSKKVSMLEKRLLMKFLKFCTEYEKQPEQYQDYIGKPFSEFLKFSKLTPNTHHFVYHAIAMATESTTTEEGLKKTQHFIQSLGRYGNTAFLFPLYGSGEIPQGFCRLCAVFGGVYCLQMSATHIITDNENKCCAVQTIEGQRIECKHLVLGPSYIPETFEEKSENNSISRAILITNKSVLLSESLELSMMHLISEDDPSRDVTMLELPPSSMVCPQDSFVVHLTRKGSGDPEKDFSSIIATLFKGKDQEEDEPCILWALYFTQSDQSVVQPSSNLPSNVHLLPGPGTDIDMDNIVDHARRVWEKICPDEDFLPKPPNPEDIIYVDDAETVVGEGGENTFEDATEDKDGTKATVEENTDKDGKEVTVEEIADGKENKEVEKKDGTQQDEGRNTENDGEENVDRETIGAESENIEKTSQKEIKENV